jgi:ribonucleotide reductase beta subunit family protein with ferritin-like domain
MGRAKVITNRMESFKKEPLRRKEFKKKIYNNIKEGFFFNSKWLDQFLLNWSQNKTLYQYMCIMLSFTFNSEFSRSL